MTLEKIKEHLSNQFIGVLAANNGYVMDKPAEDMGIDYTLKRSYQYNFEGKTRYTTDTKTIDIQLKATTESQIIDEPAQIKYDLEVKNYNDMVDRLNNGITPLALILFVLPDHRNDWVDIDGTELRLRRLAYWYRPPAGTAMSRNAATIRITIPKANILALDCFDTLHTQFYP
jgi:hypothetical protein